MEDLFTQFIFPSDQALQDKNFDPSTIQYLMKFFELESYKALAAMELEQDNEVRKAEATMRAAEVYLASAKETAMDKAKAELNELIQVSDAVWNMRKPMEKGASVASKKHVEAAMNSATASMNSATASMKSVWNGISSKKVYPS